MASSITREISGSEELPDHPPKMDADSGFILDLAEASPPKSMESIQAAAAARDNAEAAAAGRQDAHIRDRAYYLWVEGGRPEGMQDAFWWAAKAELYPK